MVVRLKSGVKVLGIPSGGGGQGTLTAPRVHLQVGAPKTYSGESRTQRMRFSEPTCPPARHSAPREDFGAGFGGASPRAGLPNPFP